MRPRRETNPHDRLTAIGSVMLDVLEKHPGASGNEKVLLLLEDGPEAATVLSGWESDAEAIAALVGHLAAVMAANGQRLVVAPIGQRPDLQ